MAPAAAAHLEHDLDDAPGEVAGAEEERSRSEQDHDRPQLARPARRRGTRRR